MIVARQFIAWKHVQSRIRPVGHGLILTPDGLTVLIVARLSDPIITSLRDVPVFARFQAINCLAAIIQSLRDKVLWSLRDNNRHFSGAGQNVRQRP
jgi:hypothetical protein